MKLNKNKNKTDNVIINYLTQCSWPIKDLNVLNVISLPKRGQEI